MLLVVLFLFVVVDLFVVVVDCLEEVFTDSLLFAVLFNAVIILLILLVKLFIAAITLFELLRKLLLYSDKTGLVPLFQILFIVDDI